MPTKAELQASLDAMQAKVYELQDAIVALTKASDDALAQMASLQTSFHQQAQRIKDAMATRFIKCRDNRYIALPLSDEERRHVEELVSDRVAEYWSEGTMIAGHYDPGNETDSDHSEWEQAFDNDYFYREGKPLPQWDGYYAAYSYSRNDGTYLHRIWGLKEIK